MNNSYSDITTRENSVRPSRPLVTMLLLCVISSAAGCVFFQQGNSANSAPGNKSIPSPARTLITNSTADSPPASLVETLRTEMRAAAPGPASERHSASKLVGESCEEISFALLETKGNQTQYIGLYRCPMKGAIAGSEYDSQVSVIGALHFENGSYSRNIVSAEASN